MFLYTHFSLGLDTLRLGLRSLPNGPTAPELEADPAVGVAHDLQGEVRGQSPTPGGPHLPSWAGSR